MVGPWQREAQRRGTEGKKEQKRNRGKRKAARGNAGWYKSGGKERERAKKRDAGHTGRVS